MAGKKEEKIGQLVGLEILQQSGGLWEKHALEICRSAGVGSPGTTTLSGGRRLARKKNENFGDFLRK